LPSHASILTGLLPYEHGIRDNAGFTLPAEIPTLGTLLESSGYLTAAFVSAFPLDRRFGLGRGFGVYDDEYEGFGGGAFIFAERPGEETISRARAWWEDHRGRRRFMWVHLFTPHFPYEPAEPFASEYGDAPYYGDVAMTDAQLAPLVEPILAAESDSTLVIVTSDHGESLGEHGEATHGLFAYESTLKIPLLFFAPGLVEPGIDTRPAGHVDVLPSIFHLLGLATPECSGRSLFAASPTENESLYFEALTAFFNRGWAPLHGRIEGSIKAIDLPVPELYDLAADPQERSNLAERRADELDSMLRALPAAAREPGRRERLDSEVVERLRSLGYVASGDGGTGSRRVFGADDDPKNLVQEEARLFEALSLYRSGKTDQAVRALREMLERRPTMAVAYGHLSYMYTDQGRLDEAAELLQRALARGVDTESIRRKLALVLLRRGRPRAAWETLAPHGESEDPETQIALGRVAAALERFEEADARIGRALELDPTFADAQIDRGILLLMQGRLAEGRGQLEAGLARNPQHAEGWNALGAAYSGEGELQRAVAAWRRAVEIDPRLPDPLFNLALSLGRAGEVDGAIDALERYIDLVDGDDRRRAEAMLRELRGSPAG
jgi:tetratricopeptide (TPR) repeat protein